MPESKTTGRKLLQDAKVAALKQANDLFQRWNASLQVRPGPPPLLSLQHGPCCPAQLAWLHAAD